MHSICLCRSFEQHENIEQCDTSAKKDAQRNIVSHLLSSPVDSEQLIPFKVNSELLLFSFFRNFPGCCRCRSHRLTAIVFIFTSGALHLICIHWIHCTSTSRCFRRWNGSVKWQQNSWAQIQNTNLQCTKWCAAFGIWPKRCREFRSVKQYNTQFKCRHQF